MGDRADSVCVDLGLPDRDRLVRAVRRQPGGRSFDAPAGNTRRLRARRLEGQGAGQGDPAHEDRRSLKRTHLTVFRCHGRVAQQVDDPRREPAADAPRIRLRARLPRARPANRTDGASAAAPATARRCRACCGFRRRSRSRRRPACPAEPSHRSPARSGSTPAGSHGWPGRSALRDSRGSHNRG